MNPAYKIAIAYFVIINLITLLMFGIDKWKAKRSRWRIPEATLILLSAIGGSIGGLLGMRLFRHKTLHKKFYIGIPVILILQILVLVILYFKFVE